MRRILLPVILIVAILTACAPQSAAPTPTATAKSAGVIDIGQTCGSIDIQPTPGPEQASAFPSVGATDHIRGPEDAAVTFIEYGDYQCPNCAALDPLLALHQQQHPQDVRIVYRHYPQPAYDKSALAAQAAEAAGLQDKFWKMHDLLYARQSEWSGLNESGFRDWLGARATELGLDQARFTADLDRAEVTALVAEAAASGQAIGLPGTPMLLINGQLYFGPVSESSLEQITGLIVLGKRQFTDCPPQVIDPSKQYIATLQTEKGDVVIQLYAAQAPLTVNNFVFLARAGWFDNITFHRVIPGFMAQTGDPSGTGYGNPGYLFINESDPVLRFDRPGVVAMANSGKDSNGSQFFITYGPASHLDGGYTIFGQVISGLEVVEQLTPRDPARDPNAAPGDRLLRVTIEER